MARISNQMKGFFSLICAAFASVAFGFASRRFDQPAGKWGLPACIGAIFFIGQVILVFIGSKEEAELAEYKRIQSAQMESDATEIENRTKIANAATERALLEIQSGNLGGAQRWSDFGRKHHGQ
jgi:hypothetical protein